MRKFTCCSIFYFTSLACLSILLVWSVSDASFPDAVWGVNTVLGFQKSNTSYFLNSLGNASFAIRVGILFTIMIAIICFMVPILYSAVRRPRATTVLMLISIIFLWVLFVSFQDRIGRARTIRQVSRRISMFESTAMELKKHWPEQSGILSSGVQYHLGTTPYADVLMLRNIERYPFQETFGPTITRYEGGIIRFDLNPSFNACLEYHPGNTYPTEHISGFGFPSPPVSYVYKIKDGWFLAYYSPDTK